jgi:hypothetical protein
MTIEHQDKNISNEDDHVSRPQYQCISGVPPSHISLVFHLTFHYKLLHFNFLQYIEVSEEGGGGAVSSLVWEGVIGSQGQ